MDYQNELKIMIISNVPSDKALKNFQKKLYEMQHKLEKNMTIHPFDANKTINFN